VGPAADWGEHQRAYQVFNDRVRHVEYLIGYEDNAFTLTGDVEQDLLVSPPYIPYARKLWADSWHRLALIGPSCIGWSHRVSWSK
jgi:hypothetical protein